ncbi:MAG TPA: hypothetical protein VIX41_05205 [Acidimicrobiales bacterium]
MPPLRAKHLPDRLLVRPVPNGLTAVRVEKPDAIALADGRTVLATRGDWRLVRGTHTLDVLTEARFRQTYEAVPSGGLTLTAAQCARLEQTVGLGVTQIPIAFILAVERLAALHIGDIRLDFTPGQLEELQHRAVKRGQTIEDAVRAVVHRIRDEIFHHGG